MGYIRGGSKPYQLTPVIMKGAPEGLSICTPLVCQPVALRVVAAKISRQGTRNALNLERERDFIAIDWVCGMGVISSEDSQDPM